jgi:hypothetical protein
MEAVRRRVQDRDDPMKPLTVRAGKGDQDRCTTGPATLIPWLQNHRAGVRTRQQQDLVQGYGEVDLPHALARKYPATATAWGWPYVFPARHLAVDPRAGITRRPHVDQSVINQASKVAVRQAGLTTHLSAHTFRPSCATHRLQRGTDIRTMQPLRGHHDVATTMLDTPVRQQGGQGVPSPWDDLGVCSASFPVGRTGARLSEPCGVAPSAVRGRWRGVEGATGPGGDVGASSRTGARPRGPGVSSRALHRAPVRGRANGAEHRIDRLPCV